MFSIELKNSVDFSIPLELPKGVSEKNLFNVQDAKGVFLPYKIRKNERGKVFFTLVTKDGKVDTSHVGSKITISIEVPKIFFRSEAETDSQYFTKLVNYFKLFSEQNVLQGLQNKSPLKVAYGEVRLYNSRNMYMEQGKKFEDVFDFNETPQFQFIHQTIYAYLANKFKLSQVALKDIKINTPENTVFIYYGRGVVPERFQFTQKLLKTRKIPIIENELTVLTALQSTIISKDGEGVPIPPSVRYV